MSCLPGMPCYNGPVVRMVFPPGCDPFPIEVTSQQVQYDGPNLPCTGVQTGDNLNTALEKIDTKICSEELVASIIQTIANNEVLKAYFCELVSSCGVITTTTTTTLPVFSYTVWLLPEGTPCNLQPTTVYSLSSSLVAGVTVYTDQGLTTPATDGYTLWIDAGDPPNEYNGSLIYNGGQLYGFNSFTDCPTTTTTTTISCATPTLNSATSDGFGNVTLNYDLNGSTLCTFVLAEYSDYPSFSPFSFSETIPDGCNQTSYILTLNTNSTQYVRVSMICNGSTLNSNILSVVPGTTTTTTTLCTTGLESHDFMTQIHDFEGNLINILTTPIGDACALLPAIQTGSGSSFYTVYVDSLAVGQQVIYSYCTPVATGTYALADGPTGSINTFIAVVDGLITQILNCGTFVTFNVNVGIDQPTACNPALSTPTYLFAASGSDIAGNTLYLDTALTTLAVDLIFNYGSSCYATNGSGVVSFVGPC